MDARPENAGDDPVVITGLGHVIVGDGDAPCDPMPYLKVKKLRKYMGVQDDLAVVAAAKALESAGLAGTPLGERAGLYLAVGYIPFEQADIEPLLAGSLDGQGRFSMERFSTDGFRQVNGLLTFRCLPNMPAFHVSVNFDIQGPYFSTYPGPGQFYLALEEALTALAEGSIDVALVGGVAHQRNILVERHFTRVEPPVLGNQLLDAAGFLVLERASGAIDRRARVREHLLTHSLAYAPHNPLEEEPTPREIYRGLDLEECPVPGAMGPASLPVMLSRLAGMGSGHLWHLLDSRDSLAGSSLWRLS
jgi:hypothetical protein